MADCPENFDDKKRVHGGGRSCYGELLNEERGVCDCWLE